jgi:uncharacterized membrane protein
MNMKERVCFPSPHTSNSEVDTTALRQKAAGTLYSMMMMMMMMYVMTMIMMIVMMIQQRVMSR